MNRVLRWHDFGSGREARRSEYREYSQGERQSHGPKLVPARRVAATTAGAPQRRAGAPLAGMRPRRHACVPRMIARPCPAPGSHPTMKPLEPAPPCAGHFVGRLAHAPRPRSPERWCGTGRKAACSGDGGTGLLRLLPQTGLRQTSRSRRDMNCATLRVINPFWLQRTRGSLCYRLLAHNQHGYLAVRQHLDGLASQQEGV